MNIFQSNLQNLNILSDQIQYIDIDLPHIQNYKGKILDYLSECTVNTGTTPIQNEFYKTVTAKNTELHVQKGSKDCLLVTGESWTYGDRLTEDSKIVVRSVDGIDDTFYRLNNIFAGHCARLMATDLYLSAVPGNSNTGIVFHLPNILKYLEQFNYENIYVIVQLTSPGRCFGDSRWRETSAYWKSFMGDALGNKKPSNSFFTKDMIVLDQWYDLYEYGMVSLIKAFCNKHGTNNILVWKNFNPVRNNNLPLPIAKLSWVEYLSKLYGYEFDLPNCNEAQWFENIDNIYIMNTVGHKRKMLELEKIEKSNEFIKSCPINHWHPQSIAHYLWAMYLIKEIGWWHEV